MSRSRRALLVISAVALLHGCSPADPGQPAPGSISIKAKSQADTDEPLVGKKGVRKPG